MRDRDRYKEGLTKCTRCAKVLEVDWLMVLCSMCRIKKLEKENLELKKQLEDQNTKLSKLSYSTLNAITRDIEEYDEIN